MIIGVFLEDQLYIEKLHPDFYAREYIVHSNQSYSFEAVDKLSFEIGFYDWIIHEDTLYGVCLKVNNREIIDLKKIEERRLNNVHVTNDSIFFFFKTVDEYWIDYEDNFIALYVLKSTNGYLCFTFEIPENIEYKLAL